MLDWQPLLIIGAVLMLVGFIVFKKLKSNIWQTLSYAMLIVGGVLVLLGLIYLILAQI